MKTNEIAAHKIADAFATIASWAGKLSPDQLSALLPGLATNPGILPDLIEMWQRREAELRATAPFDALTEAECGELTEFRQNEAEDMDARDVYDAVFGDTSAWQDRADYDYYKEEIAEAEAAEAEVEELAYAGGYGL